MKHLLTALTLVGLFVIVLHNAAHIAELERVNAIRLDCPNRPGVSADIQGPPTEETIAYCLGGLSCG